MGSVVSALVEGSGAALKKFPEDTFLIRPKAALAILPLSWGFSSAKKYAMFNTHLAGEK